MYSKVCTKCGQTLPATTEFFYKNAGGKFGLTPRCKPCVNKDNAEVAAKTDPEHKRILANARAKRYYENNLEKARESSRNSAAKARNDPTKREKIYARKRAGGAGLTPEKIETIKQAQNNKCAICGDENPTDLDHCHKTGKIRWLLCKHCNRGLGAFRDNPNFLRKAANMLDAIES